MAAPRSGTQPATGGANLPRPGDERSDALVASTIEGIIRFGCALYRVGTDPNRNAVLSPLGVGHACGMVRVGARRSTAAQIDNVLGVPGAAGHSALSRLTWQILTGSQQPRRALASPGTPATPTLRIASGLFIDHTRQVEPSYLRAIWTQYALGLHTVNFASARSVETINSWVSHKTGGRIQDLIGSLNPRTQLMLRNSTYLSAPWRERFDAAATEPAPFTRSDGTVLTAQFMRRTGLLRYTAGRRSGPASGGGWQAIELRYAGTRQAMWILLPDSGAQVAEMITPEMLAEVGRTLRPAVVDLALPRWRAVDRLDLVGALREMRLSELCSPGADLSGISGMPGSLWLDQAVHHASIVVNEDGTDPPDPTASEVADGPAAPEVTARADRAFGFAVIDLPTRLPLIVGHVAEPDPHG